MPVESITERLDWAQIVLSDVRCAALAVTKPRGCRGARLSHGLRQILKSAATHGDRRRLTPVFRQFASILLDSEARGRAITPVLNWLTDLQRVTPVSLM